ncbi:MAG TPA: hypothetical protein VMX96_04670 [Dehalococcoidia bacterium]|nr:hypothetical protein [Dehalococcoidia bacterium]
MVSLYMGFLTFMGFIAAGAAHEIVGVLYIVKQILLDLAGLLEGNVTAVLNTTIDWVSALADVLYDVEALLEKVITMLIS